MRVRRLTLPPLFITTDLGPDTGAVLLLVQLHAAVARHRRRGLHDHDFALSLAGL